MLPKIDKNNDTFIDGGELKAHIALMAQKYVDDDVKRTWGYHPHKDGKLDFKTYRKSVTGHAGVDFGVLFGYFVEQRKEYCPEKHKPFKSQSQLFQKNRFAIFIYCPEKHKPFKSQSQLFQKNRFAIFIYV